MGGGKLFREAEEGGGWTPREDLYEQKLPDCSVGTSSLKTLLVIGEGLKPSRTTGVSLAPHLRPLEWQSPQTQQQKPKPQGHP